MPADEQMFTGMTSQSFAKAKKVKEVKKKELSIKRTQLLPAGDILNAEFEKEIAKISHIDYVKLDKLTNSFEVKAELMAQQRTEELLRMIQQRMTNLLRDNKE